MSYCLDTNIVIAALNGNELVTSRLGSIPLHDILVPLMVIAELMYGAQRSARRDANLARVQRVLDRFRIAGVEVATQREANPTAAPTPLPEPNYPSLQWEVVQIMHGMILMLDPTQGPVLRRVANEIYRHFAASTAVVTR